MPPIILSLLQALFLLLLYAFVARAVRWVVRDIAHSAAPARLVAPAPKAPPRERRRRARSAPNELVVHTPGNRPRIVPLDGEVTLGRAPDVTVALDDAYVSDHHARIYADGDGEWLVVDTGSTNGTYLNQVKVTSPTPLAAGDQLGMGKTVVQVRR